VKVAFPVPSTATAAICVEPLENVTVPVGIAVPDAGVILADSKTLVPETAVAGVTVKAVLVAIGLTTSVVEVELLPE
jgi:hypothetical protein